MLARHCNPPLDIPTKSPSPAASDLLKPPILWLLSIFRSDLNSDLFSSLGPQAGETLSRRVFCL